MTPESHPPRARSPQRVDEALFRRLWHDGASYEEIADAIHISEGSVYAVSVRLDLPRRQAGCRRPVGRIAAPIVNTRPARACPVAAPHPFWTPDRDGLVWATEGKHAALAELAATIGKSIAEVQRRWHGLRAGA